MVYLKKILPLAPFRLKEHQRNKEHLNWRTVTQVESKESKVIEILQGEPSTIYPGCPERACGHNTADTTSQLCPLQSVIVIQWKLYTSLMTNCAFSVEYISLAHFWMIKIKGLFYSFIPCNIIFQFFSWTKQIPQGNVQKFDGCFLSEIKLILHFHIYELIDTDLFTASGTCKWLYQCPRGTELKPHSPVMIALAHNSNGAVLKRSNSFVLIDYGWASGQCGCVIWSLCFLWERLTLFPYAHR